MRRLLARPRVSGDTGASAVEYGLLIAGVAAVLVAALFLFGSFVRDTMAQSCTTISQQTSPGVDCTP